MISVVIPTYEQHGKGVHYLTLLLRSLFNQRGGFEVIVSDNSKDDVIKQLCEKFATNLNLKYVHNPIVGISANFNRGINEASYEKIKLMCQDDLLTSPLALTEFEKALDHSHWAVSASTWIDENGHLIKYHGASWNKDMLKGVNSIGMPSVTAFKKNEFEFDTNLTTLSDCEYYWLLMEKYGPPKWINKALVAQRFHSLSVSNTQAHKGREEYEYLKQKHGL